MARIDPERQKKDEVVIRALAAGSTPTQALHKAGYSKNFPATSIEVLVDAVKKRYQEANGHMLISMESKGLDFDYVAAKIHEGLEAVVSRKQGKILVDVPDFPTRHRYLETALAIMGAKAITQQKIEVTDRKEVLLTVVDGIKDNPGLLDIVRQKLEEKRRTVEIDQQGDVIS